MTSKTRTENPIIKIEDVWKVYYMGEVEVPALKGISIDIYPREFVAIMGPSGSGKSTAMNMVGCLDIPTKGRILLDGQDISHLEESDLAQIRGKKIGFVFQQFNLISNLTALENVTLPMIFQDVPSIDRERIAVGLLKKMGLEERVYHKPTELSGGEQQRVAIARALANNPDVVLADEPTGNLDSKVAHEIVDMLSELNKEGKTIIIVTHEIDIAEHAERIIHLKDGRTIEADNHDIILKRK